MRMSSRVFRALFASACFGLLACGDGGSGSTEGGSADAGAGHDAASASSGNSADFSKGSIFPSTVGSTWTYRVTDSDGTVTTKQVRAEAEETVGGDGPYATAQAIKLVSDRGSELTYAWVHVERERAVRYREQDVDSATSAVKSEHVYDPARVIVDASSAHRTEGATWLEVFNDTSTNVKKGTPPTTSEVRESWQVLSAGEEVTVPAGTFIALVLQKTVGSKQKEYWYVPGVGKVKETGGQTEELSAFDIAK